jgi:hypothetical protein
MFDTARLAGFFTAHGIWSVSGGETLIPILGYEHGDGEYGMDRFVLDDVGDGARAGQESLRLNKHDASRAVLVVDGYVHLDTGKTDSLIVDAVNYDGGSLKIAVPYRPQPSSLGFAVHRPKFLEIGGVDRRDYEALGEAFFEGVDSHEAAAQVWNAHYDPSL